MCVALIVCVCLVFTTVVCTTFPLLFHASPTTCSSSEISSSSSMSSHSVRGKSIPLRSSWLTLMGLLDPCSSSGWCSGWVKDAETHDCLLGNLAWQHTLLPRLNIPPSQSLKDIKTASATAVSMIAATENTTSWHILANTPCISVGEELPVCLLLSKLMRHALASSQSRS